MDVENSSDEISSRKRRTWPAVVAGTGVIGAATLTFALLNPLGTSSAQANELTRFNDCDALARHMSGLVMDRLLDSRRAYDEYRNGGGEEAQSGSGTSGFDESVTPDRAVPPVPAGAPEVGTDAGTTTSGTDTSTGTMKSGAATGATGTAATAGAPAAAPAGGDSLTAGRDAAGAAAAAPPQQNASKSDSGASPSDAVGNSASGTNNQEAGVDEADLAKTDGKLLVTARDSRLVVMDVRGKAPKARGSVVLPGQRALELLLAGDRAIVIGTADSHERYLDDEVNAASKEASELTTVTVVDLSDPDEPLILSSEEISARYLSARMTGDTVRIVFSSTPDVLRTFSSGWSGWSGKSYYAPRDDRGSIYDDDTYLADARAHLSRLSGEDWLPTVRNIDRKARTATETPLLGCSDVRYPVADSGLDMLTVLSVDTGRIDSLARAAATGLIGSGDLVYATQDKLFVATTDGGWNDGWNGGSRTSGVTTRVHSFDISGANAEYLASGRVDGYLYGRWAMSEKDGLLRMVTTTTPPWNRGGGSQTGVVVLDTTGKRMREIGRADGMGLTEQVRSVRWFDDVAAIVTYRQTDPLYLVDLSHPESPRVRGELKVPGYSSYLHPIGDHRLLGIGQDNGLQVSNFDILDLADPQQTDVLNMGYGTSSPVENDPRGFVYLPSSSLAVLPVFGNGGGFTCPPNAKCAVPAPMPMDGPLSIAPSSGPVAMPGYAPAPRNGLVAVRVSDDGKLKKVASWTDRDDRRVIKLIPLPDGRIVALDYLGVRIFDADSLKLYGSALYR